MACLEPSDPSPPLSKPRRAGNLLWRMGRASNLCRSCGDTGEICGRVVPFLLAEKARAWSEQRLGGAVRRCHTAKSVQPQPCFLASGFWLLASAASASLRSRKRETLKIRWTIHRLARPGNARPSQPWPRPCPVLPCPAYEIQYAIAMAMALRNVAGNSAFPPSFLSPCSWLLICMLLALLLCCSAAALQAGPSLSSGRRPSLCPAFGTVVPQLTRRDSPLPRNTIHGTSS
jgi:hypothetical protein